MLGLIISSLATQVFTLPADVPENKIIGGSVVTPKFKYPWLASIQLGNVHECAGTLVNPTTMITAAHCSQLPLFKGLSVLAHRNTLSTPLESENALKFKVTKIDSHPEFDEENYNFDVAVWKLELVSGNATDLPTTAFEFDDGKYSSDNTTLTIAGWGMVYAEGPYADNLRQAKVEVVPTKICEAKYRKLHSTSICAIRPGRDACEGDSGGPLFTITEDGRVVLVGIVSYGECGRRKFPGVYSRISVLSDWIKPLL